MRRFSINLGTYGGIPVKLHWTFWFIFIIVAYTGWVEGMVWLDIVLFMSLTICLFFCVLLHEYGHALTASRFGIDTQDIILSPIGGIARMKAMPDNPTQEILVAIAGPLVNVFICSLLGIIIWLMGWNFLPELEVLSFQSVELFVVTIFWLNAILFLFNLIPAFPMDGGRVFRALLSYRWSKLTATRVAAYAGQAIALTFILIGLWNHQFTLPFIGVFIIITGQNELRNAKYKHLYLTTTAEDIMDRQFSLDYSDRTVQDVYLKLDESPHSTVVIHDYHGRIYGSITKQDLKNGYTSEILSHMPISQVLQSTQEPIYAHQSLNDVMTVFNKNQNSSIPVLSGKIIVGTINRTSLQDWIDKH